MKESFKHLLIIYLKTNSDYNDPIKSSMRVIHDNI